MATCRECETQNEMTLCQRCIHGEICANRDCFDEGDERALTFCANFLDKSDYVKRERGEWISVKDRLPKELREQVLVVDEKGTMAIGILVNEDNIFFDSYCSYDITHWQPLPEPPNITTEDALCFVLFSDFMKGGAE